MSINSISAVCRTALACALLLTCAHASAQFVGNNSEAADKRVNELVSEMTLDEKIDLISGDTPFRTRPVPRLNIPFFQMADGPVGAHIPAPTMAYAAGIGLAASWDKRLAVRIGEELGRDCRSRGAVFLLGPGVNIYRAPMNGRNFEYFGEDPFLASQIAVGYIQGVQKQAVSATVKHYLGNNSEYLRHDTDSAASCCLYPRERSASAWASFLDWPSVLQRILLIQALEKEEVRDLLNDFERI
jgi:beta-glucosidase